MQRQMKAPAEPSRQPSDAASEAEEKPDFFDKDTWENCDDVERFELSRACANNDRKLSQTEPSDELSAFLRLDQLVAKQKSDFFQTLLQ